MFPGMNPRQMQGMMKKLGIKQQEIDAEEVVIKLKDKELIIRNPQVSKINMMGQETFQIVGDVEEVSGTGEEDIKVVIEQCSCSREDAVKALEKNEGDIAKAILSIKKE
ncbi:MAG: nascent polypeptide-associated complex protein [Nanoarchaeota archaeon]|nr:nascent polypeptide-associated complex protein [Nanoarchaeota archaeon]